MKIYHITSQLREVLNASEKFGWSLQGGASKSLLYVFSARKNREVKRSDSMTQATLIGERHHVQD